MGFSNYCAAQGSRDHKKGTRKYLWSIDVLLQGAKKTSNFLKLRSRQMRVTLFWKGSGKSPFGFPKEEKK